MTEDHQRPEFVSGKVVVIISPQPWGPLRISKHHYALECCRYARRVYFLNPPSAGLLESVSIRSVAEAENLSVIDYRPRFPFRLRFHARPLFDLLMRWQVRAIRAAIREKIDVVWCFDFNLFTDLRLWTNGKRIFHPVDPVGADHQLKPAHSSSAVFSVSEEILRHYRKMNCKAVLLNHGVASCFLKSDVPPADSTVGEVSFGYVGNLTRGPVDRELCRELVEQFPSVKFVFWGPYESSQGNLGGAEDADARKFVAFLKNADNVVLRGPVSPENLAEEMPKMHGFLLMYRQNEEYDCSNAHKILEYLSTGRVIISTPISSYKNRSDLIHMAADRLAFIERFRNVLAHLEENNSDELAEQRRKMARENSYERHLFEVDKIITCGNRRFPIPQEAQERD